MVLAGFVVFLGGQTAAQSYDFQVVPYAWDSSANPGSGSPLRMGDDYERYRSMGHTFPFYGGNYNSLSISSNGWVKIGIYDTYMTYGNYRIGVQYYYDADRAIMPLWDDLNPYMPGYSRYNINDVYYYTDSTKTVVTWWDIPHYYNSGRVTFQLVLKPNGGFRFNYMSFSPNPPSTWTASIGCALYNNIGDATEFYYNGWLGEYGIRPTDYMSVESKVPEPTILEVTDAAFMRDTISAGGGGIATVTFQNTGPAEAKITDYTIGGADIAMLEELSDPIPQYIQPGDSYTVSVALYTIAGTADGSTTSLDITISYNSMSGQPLVASADINIQWFMSGGDRSDYVHSQDALRHSLRLYYNIGAGYVTDGGELDAAVAAFNAGDYKQAKNEAVKPGGPGLGFWGLSPGQVQGNEGNGNGGLNGN
jgi:hypothetical protein